MNVGRAHPRHWSPRLATVTVAVLWLLMMSFFVAVFALGWRGHQLSGVRANHVVRRDGDRYYQKPTGPYDLRETISRRQAQVYERYERYQTWAGMTGGVFLLAILLIGFARRNEETPPSVSDRHD